MSIISIKYNYNITQTFKSLILEYLVIINIYIITYICGL